VRRGDTLSQIARRYGTSVRALQQTNGMGRRTMIREGAVLRVPTSSASLRAGPSWQDVADYQTGETVRYRVRRGDALSTIARRFRTTVPVIQRMNGLGRSTRIYAGQTLKVTYGQRSTTAVAAAPPRRAPAGSASGGTVTVRRGDSLIAIARRHGTSVAALQEANGLGRSTRIYAGQTLRLPGDAAGGGGPAVHRVRRGDTLSRIARRYGTSVRQLCRWNDMDPTDTLYPGQRLIVSR
jgi:LysM repeat protein